VQRLPCAAATRTLSGLADLSTQRGLASRWTAAPGYMCPPASASPIPATCPAGTYVSQNFTGDIENECLACPLGYACGGGRSQPSICLAGTIAPRNGTAICSKCEAGTYQTAEGQTACFDCYKGFYCPRGSATAIPCKGGTFGNATRLSRNTSCVAVMQGKWAPTGAPLPEDCLYSRTGSNAGLAGGRS